VIESGLRKADRYVFRLTVYRNRTFIQWKNIGEGKFLVEFCKFGAGFAGNRLLFLRDGTRIRRKRQKRK